MTYNDMLATRIHKLRRQIIALWAVLVALMIVVIYGLMLILGNQAAIMVMQTERVEVRMEAPEPVEAEPTASYTLTDAEFDLICRVVAAESRGEDLQGQMAVAQVILDRAVLWDMTPTEVVTASGQFAGPYTGEISDETRLAVANVFEGGVRVFEEPVTHFHADYVDPYWTDSKTSRGSVGRHEFWY